MNTKMKTKSMEQLDAKTMEKHPGTRSAGVPKPMEKGMKFSEAETKISAIFGSREPFFWDVSGWK